MQNKETFSGYHPLVNFLYFALVLVFGMCFMHPACLVISMGNATAYNLYLKGRKGLLFSLRFLLPMLILAAILNPVFNYEGITILAYTPKRQPHHPGEPRLRRGLRRDAGECGAVVLLL